MLERGAERQSLVIVFRVGKYQTGRNNLLFPLLALIPQSCILVAFHGPLAFSLVSGLDVKLECPLPPARSV